MPFVVMDAEVAATENKVLGSFPNLLPATAFIPAWKPIVGLAAILGITVMPERLWVESFFLWGNMTWLTKSPKSYCCSRFSTVFCLPAFMRNESAFRESDGVTCACKIPQPEKRTVSKKIFNVKFTI